MSEQPAVLASAPEELTSGRLRRLGEGVGNVVYASTHWVVRRERTPFELVALIVLWRALRKVERLLPGKIGKRLVTRPARQIRLLRVITQAVLLIAPKRWWMSATVRAAWSKYKKSEWRGEVLADSALRGSGLIPEKIAFPTIRVNVIGWPGWLMVSEAAERVECTLLQRLLQLSKQNRFDEIEQWLERLLSTRQAGWRQGLFSLDAHLKNFGVTGDRIVLLDTGGLTDRWHEVEEKLAFEEAVAQPHVQLGLGTILATRPDIAHRFDAQWKALVNRTAVLALWPQQPQSPR